MTRRPTEPPDATPPGLQDERLRRLEDALAEGRAREAAAVEAWVRQTGRMPSRKVRRKWEKKWRRQAEREARRAAQGQREDESRSPAQGVAYAAIAVTCVVLALGQPRRLWWLVFVALGFFLAAAKHLERRGSRAGAPGREAEALPSGRERLAETLTSERGWATGGAEAQPSGEEAGADALASGRGADADALASGRGVDAAARASGRGVDAEARASGRGVGQPAAARVSGREVGRVRASAEPLPSGREVGRVRAGAGGQSVGPSRDAGRGAGGASEPGFAPEDARGAKVDVLCGKLLAELREGPPVLREVVHAPERTVEALRQGCHALARRERELRALSAPEETQRLESEREALSARIAAEADTVVRERLSGALAALDEQRRQRAELAVAANRLEAEHTRLYYTLESLYAQVLRVRTADAAGQDVAGAGLRQGVERLGEEVEAVARALEEVHREPPHPDGRGRTR